ncbi:MAG TPA: tetratricopeptide repeat protein [Phycisphaerales bacterium]|nr:tetratricopeptide repeat protein [Phycisphaerales bacterium]
MNARIATVLGLATVLAVSGGCNNGGQHSKHTSEGIKLAQRKINALKSSVEWETAERQFLAGDLDKSLRTLERSINITPDVPKCYVLKGRILIEKGAYEAAEQCLLTAESLDSTNVDAQYYLGVIGERQSQFAKALSRYNTAMELDPTSPQYVIAASEMYIQLGQVEKGEELLREKATDFTSNAGIRHALGQLEMLRSQFDKASEYFNEARLLAPDDLHVLEDLTRSLIACRRYGEAEINLAVLLKAPANEKRSDLQVLRVRCLAAMDRLAEARTLMGTVITSGGHDSDVSAWILYGNICARLEDPVRLRTAVQRITTLAPDRPEGYALRAMLLRMSNQQSAAFQAINTAISLNPNDPEQWVIRGLIQAESGEFAQSQRSLRTALRLDAGNANATTLLNAVASLASQPLDTADATPKN